RDPGSCGGEARRGPPMVERPAGQRRIIRARASRDSPPDRGGRGLPDRPLDTSHLRREASMLTKKDILEAIGVDGASDRFVAGMLVGIGVGAMVGSAVAMLLAPRTGAEMRHLIGERSADLVEKAKTKIGIGAGHDSGARTAETTPR